MNQEGTRELVRWRVRRVRCWFKAMLAHFDDLLATVLAGVILRSSGMVAAKAVVRGKRG